MLCITPLNIMHKIGLPGWLALFLYLTMHEIGFLLNSFQQDLLKKMSIGLYKLGNSMQHYSGKRKTECK